MELAPDDHALSWLSHNGSIVEELSDMEADMAGVWLEMQAAKAKLSGHTPQTELLQIFIPNHLESELALAIQDLELRKSVEEALTPGELYRALMKALERHVESLLSDMHEILTKTRDRWTYDLLKPYEGHFLSEGE